MNSTLVIYHRSDLDGICSREIAHKFLGNTADYLGFEYGDDLPQLAAYQTVYLIDISLPPGVMALHADKLIWIDHHQSAIEAMKGVDIRGYRIDGVAACRLAWQYFEWEKLVDPRPLYPSKDDYTSIPTKVVEPRAVELLGRYDIWDKRLPEVDLFQLGMQAESAPSWSKLLTLPDGTTDMQISDRQQTEPIIQNGRAIHAYTTVTSAQIITERGFDVTFEGLRFRALNIARCNSMTFLAALKPEHDGCLGYFWDGKKWKFSLYGVPGKPDVDLSKIASKYGGGGHKQACGGFFKQLPTEFGGVSGGAQA
ncbi:MAG: hypothetical protein WCV82_03840 [Candidatus Paceibacterota bacterium]